MRRMYYFLIALLAPLCATTTPPAEAARRIAVDLNTQLFQACTYGSEASCTPIDIGFNIFGGAGGNTSIYIYSNGLVSIDKALSSDKVDSILDLGGNVIAPAFLDTVPAVFDVFAEQGWYDFDPVTGTPVPGTTAEFRIDWYPDGTVAAPNPGPFQLRILDGCKLYQGCSWEGKVALWFGYGGAGANPAYNGSEVSHPALLPLGSQIGIDVGSNRQGFRVTPGFNIDDYDFTYVLSSVPEPSVWLELVLGFGFIGSILRKCTTRSMNPEPR